MLVSLVFGGVVQELVIGGMAVFVLRLAPITEAKEVSASSGVSTATPLPTLTQTSTPQPPPTATQVVQRFPSRPKSLK